MAETDEILELLRDVCGCPEIGPDTELLDSGLLDSLAYIRLLDELDDRGVELLPTRVPRAAFSTARAVAALCEKAEG